MKAVSIVFAALVLLTLLVEVVASKPASHSGTVFKADQFPKHTDMLPDRAGLR